MAKDLDAFPQFGMKEDLQTADLSNMNHQPQQLEPDPDAIKMFVGQVPRNMDENDLRKMFEEFGPIYQMNVLRDKVTSQSKGCCFVTFYTRKAALDAQNALHNIKTMSGMHHPVQMKPADSEKRNEERKLFIGMISKAMSEDDVRMMFSPYGTIEDCTVLRDQHGQSRGCAFVTFTTRQSAQNAIKNVHHAQTMEGCSSAVVVKFADTQKEKEAKKAQQMGSNLWGMAALGGLGPLGSQYLALLQQAASGGNMGGFGNLGNPGGGSGGGGANLNALGLQQLLATAAVSAASNPGGGSGGGGANLNALGLQQLLATAAVSAASNPGDGNNLQHLQNMQGIAALANAANNPAAALNALGMQNFAQLNQLSGNNSGAPNTAGNMSSNSSANNALSSLQGMGASGNNNMSANSMSSSGPSGMNNSINGFGSNPMANVGMGNMGSMGNMNQSGMDALSQAYSGIQQYAASFPNAFSNQASAHLQQSSNNPAGKVSEGAQTNGPDGANLFIYHLPQEFSDHDLMQTFIPFGSVVSAKVYIDKQTNLSKCFGFVSYDNAVSAQAAIQAMNGFQIGMKRLKVQLKRPKSEGKPY